MSYNSILELMKGGKVRRYHTETLIGPEQTVSQHSWGVAVLVDILWPEASKELVLAAIYHDAHEAELGDIPAPTKRQISAETDIMDEMEFAFHHRTNTLYERNLSLNDKARLKIADYLELVMFCQHQVKMGNTHIKKVGLLGVEYVNELLERNPDIMSGESYTLAANILES